MHEELYKELNVKRDASEAQIKKAYRQLARDLHPDRNPGDKAAEERFKRVSHAYEVLSDSKKRKLYDEFGELGLREGFDPQHYRAASRWPDVGTQGDGSAFRDIFSPSGGRQVRVNLNDLQDLFGGASSSFEEFFKGGPGRPPETFETTLEIDFVDAVRGCERSLRLAVGETERPLRVRIPAGAEDGDKLRLKGQAPAGGPAGQPGDVLLQIRVRPHPFFRREGADLHLDLPVGPWEAMHGAQVSVPTPSGEVNLRVPAGTQSGRRLRLRGRGVHRRGRAPGDLFVQVAVRLPEAVDDESRAALQLLQERLGADLRADLRF
ncbi:MAG: DnaJ C-terminal domain-containing protein [Polyangiales bacterium]